MLEGYMTTPVSFATKEIMNYQIATLMFCFFIALSVYLLLPAGIEKNRRISASLLIFIGLFGLFSILLKTLLAIIG
jgi:uncharacterized Tic20 family protein